MAAINTSSRVPRTVDELLQQKAALCPTRPFLSCPNTSGVFATYTNNEIHSLTEHFARIYLQNLPGLGTKNEIVVAILGVSNLQYIASILALSRLHLSVLLLSTRITDAAYIHLLKLTGCSIIFLQPSFESTVSRLVNEHGLLLKTALLSPVPPVETLDTALPSPFLHEDIADESERAAWIIHSSGSTGLPKPVRHVHRFVLHAASTMAERQLDLPSYITLPFSHTLGSIATISALFSGSCVTLHNAERAFSLDNIMSAIYRFPPGVIYTVPYVLKMLASTEAGLGVLKCCQSVCYGGSSFPTALGDKLVNEGVPLWSFYGCTESASMMSSIRDYKADFGWEYLRPMPAFVPFQQWEWVYGEVYELVVKSEWPSKAYSNRSDGSFATSDLFEKHPTDEDKWKYIGRVDDIVVLANGEKFNPVLAENTIGRSAAVKHAVICGTGRAQAGLLVFPTSEERQFTANHKLWPFIKEANAHLPSFARLTPNAVMIMPANTEYAITDKGTAIRKAILRQFSDAIENLYEKLEFCETDQSSALKLSICEMKDYVRNSVASILRLIPSSQLTDETDFFTLGLDSIMAMELWRKFSQELHTSSHQIIRNIAFEKPNVTELSRYLHDLRFSSTHDMHPSLLPPFQYIQDLISKYSNFGEVTDSRDISCDLPYGEFILLTGATGSLGAHILAQLLQTSRVRKIYCLVRSREKADSTTLYNRVVKSLGERQLSEALSNGRVEKLVCLPEDLQQETLGLSSKDLDVLLAMVTVVFHAAWPVNFSMDIRSFEPHIKGAYHLMKFCIKSRRPTLPVFNFCSSISVALRSTETAITEDFIPELEDCLPIGYAQSKLVVEHICASNKSIPTRILRLGQLIGDTRNGIWNAGDEIALTVQTAHIIHALPVIPEKDGFSWLPIDIAASAILEISLQQEEDTLTSCITFNICHPKLLLWNTFFLPALRDCGLEFESVEQAAWLKRLYLSEQDPKSNPPAKLMNYLQMRYASVPNFKKAPQISTRNASRYSPSLRSASPVDRSLIEKSLRYWQRNCWQGWLETLG